MRTRCPVLGQSAEAYGVELSRMKPALMSDFFVLIPDANVIAIKSIHVLIETVFLNMHVLAN